MIVIYPDCNALWNNISLANDVGMKLRAELEATDSELCMSPVVLSELNRRATGELEESSAKLLATIRSATKGRTTMTAPIFAAHDSLVKELRVGIDTQLVELAGIPEMVEADWPDVSARQMGERELSRRRPFIDTERGTIGHRDAIIWEGVLARMEDFEEEDHLVFVSKDNGFRAKDGALHSDLLKDLGDRVDPDQFTIVPSIFDAITVFELRRDAISLREATIRNALSSFSLQLIGDSWDFEGVAAPGGLEEVTVVDVEYLGDESIGEGDPAECEFDLNVTLEGAMRRDEWSQDDPNISSWGGLINDHYVSVSTSQSVRVTAEVYYDPSTQETEISVDRMFS